MVLDFILIFAVIFSAFLGMKKGFSQMLLTCLVFLGSIAFVIIIYSFLGDVILKSEYGQNIYSSISGSIEEYITAKENDIIDNAPYLSVLGLNDVFEKNKEFFDDITLKTIRALLAIPLLIISYFILKILVYFVRKILRKTTSLPIIHGIDSILGGVCGVLSGFILSGIIYFISSYIQLVPMFEFVREQFSSSYIVLLINDFVF